MALAELSGVRSAFHSPADIATPASGYQESHPCNAATHDVFPGTPVVREGHLYPSNEPRWAHRP